MNESTKFYDFGTCELQQEAKLSLG